MYTATVIGALLFVIILISFVVLAALISFGIHRYVYKLYDDCESKAGRCWVIGFILSAIIMTCFGIYALGAGELKSEFSHSYNIYAIQDTSKIEGSRYYVKENMEYLHLADYNDGKRMYSVPNDKSYIVENDNVQPHIEVYKKAMVNPNIFTKYTVEILEYEYKIVVPKLTLEESFKIDLKK